MEKLYDVILKKKQETNAITTNPILSAMDLEFCKKIDDLVDSDSFIAERVKRCINELSLTSIDYSEHYCEAYNNYSEAVTYICFKERGVDIEGIAESRSSTPDFTIHYKYKNWEDIEEEHTINMEQKSLAFADRNNNYYNAQDGAVKCNIEIERQQQCGRRICSSEYSIMPMAKNGSNLNEVEQIEELIKKITNNLKSKQIKQNPNAILFVDLNQLWFTSNKGECLPAYPDLIHKCIFTGRLWDIAFCEIGDRVFVQPQFDGKPSLANSKLNMNGVMVDFEMIKGLIFGLGTKPEEKQFFGFLRTKEENTPVYNFITEYCDFYNDERNTNGFEYFKEEIRKIEERVKSANL